MEEYLPGYLTPFVLLWQGQGYGQSASYGGGRGLSSTQGTGLASSTYGRGAAVTTALQRSSVMGSRPPVLSGGTTARTSIPVAAGGGVCFFFFFLIVFH